MIYIGIDPGSASGAAAMIAEDEWWNYPLEFGKTTLLDMYEYFRSICDTGQECSAVLERVHTMPDTRPKAATSFNRNVGHIQMALVANNIPFREVTPRTWMKHFGMKKDKSETKGQWKKRLRDLAERRLPYKITADTADAYLMALYLKETLS